MAEQAKFILSKSILLKQYNLIKSVCDEVSFSTKTNYEAAKILESETDCHFSVHSVEGTGTIKDKARVWYFPQGWDAEEVRQTIAEKALSFVIDNEADLKVLLDSIKTTTLKINLLLRMRMKENTIHTGKYFVYGFYSDQVNKMVPELRKNKNIGKLGIHFHRKTQNLSEWQLREELSDALDESSLKCLDCVNIGGGFPIKYKNFQADVLPRIFEEMKGLKEFLNKRNIRLISEPGRFIAGPAVKLQASIISMYDNSIIINCSVYNSAMDTFVASTKLEVEGELNGDDEAKGTPYTIKGYTPDSMDIFRYRVYLKQPKVGDKIVFLNAGAYNFSTDFCSLKRLKTEIVE